jgi:hypothetical protein
MTNFSENNLCYQGLAIRRQPETGLVCLTDIWKTHRNSVKNDPLDWVCLDTTQVLLRQLVKQTSIIPIWSQHKQKGQPGEEIIIGIPGILETTNVDEDLLTYSTPELAVVYARFLSVKCYEWALTALVEGSEQGGNLVKQLEEKVPSEHAKKLSRRRALIAAGWAIPLIASMGLAQEGSAQNQTNAFQIEIDATMLFTRSFLLGGSVTTGIFDSTVVQSISLPAGTYLFQITAGQFTSLIFQVKENGTVDYSSDFDGFLKGRGSSRLVIEGYEVTLDARYIGMNEALGLLLVTLGDSEFFLKQTIRLVPSSYGFQQGAALVSSWEIELGIDGLFKYNPEYDIANRGFLGGHGTSTVVFFGYPFLVDATKSGGNFFIFSQILSCANPGASFNNLVVFSNLLPMKTPFAMQVESGIGNISGVLVRLDGTIDLQPLGEYELLSDDFNGLTRISLRTKIDGVDKNTLQRTCKDRHKKKKVLWR